MVPAPRAVLAAAALDAVITPIIGVELTPVPPSEIGTMPAVIFWPSIVK